MAKIIPSYHLHIYFDHETQYLAEAMMEEFKDLNEELSDSFSSDMIRVGKMHLKPVGPHSKPMFQVAISHFVFEPSLNYLMRNRQGLSVLIHPETGNAVKDHTEHAMWMGAILPLDLSKL